MQGQKKGDRVDRARYILYARAIKTFRMFNPQYEIVSYYGALGLNLIVSNIFHGNVGLSPNTGPQPN
jgi:hypothetical protein